MEDCRFCEHVKRGGGGAELWSTEVYVPTGKGEDVCKVLMMRRTVSVWEIENVDGILGDDDS